MLQLNLDWVKNTDGTCYTLEGIQPTNQYFDNLNPGVYLIWQPGNAPIYAGQGEIGNRLNIHRQTYQPHTQNLLVSWAEVLNANDRNSIEVYLHQQLSPLHSTCNLTDPPIPVSLPWE